MVTSELSTSSTPGVSPTPFTPERESDARFIARGDGLYEPTIHAQGAWREDEQHLGATSGLITHALTRHEPRAGMDVSRLSFEVYGQIPLRPTQIRVETVRPGRTIELLRATATVDGRTIIVAHAWRLASSDTTAVAGTDFEPIPSIDECEPRQMDEGWSGGYIASTDRRHNAAYARPGRSQSWITSDVKLVAGEDASQLAEFMTFVDAANGVAARVSPQEWMFPNVDLTVHLFRQPVPGPTGLDTLVSLGPAGLGLTASTLHDVRGPLGRVAQSLTVREIS